MMIKCKSLPIITDHNIWFRDVALLCFRSTRPAYISDTFVAWQEETNATIWKRFQLPVMVTL